MKKYITTFCLFAMSLTTSVAFANYLVVTSNQIAVTPEGMFVTIGELPIQVESLNVANNGYIVAIPSPQTAICPKCGSDKYVPGRFCPICGFPDDDSRKDFNQHALVH